MAGGLTLYCGSVLTCSGQFGQTLNTYPGPVNTFFVGHKVSTSPGLQRKCRRPCLASQARFNSTCVGMCALFACMSVFAGVATSVLLPVCFQNHHRSSERITGFLQPLTYTAPLRGKGTFTKGGLYIHVVSLIRGVSVNPVRHPVPTATSHEQQ